MPRYNLNFISDEDLYNHVKDTVEKYSFDIDLKSFNSNLIDPVKLTFDSEVYGQGIHQTIENEVLRQLDKSNSNHIGYFQQNIFEYIGEGWILPNEVWDIACPEKKILVEMKNKHNTMNSASARSTYIKMQNALIEDKDNVCLLVEVIAKNSQDIPWSTTIDKQKVSHPNIRRVSIDKFYELVTGDKNAFRDLCQILPTVIRDVVTDIDDRALNNTVFQELEEISDDLLTSIYLLSFSNYEGFNDFNLDEK